MNNANIFLTPKTVESNAFAFLPSLTVGDAPEQIFDKNKLNFNMIISSYGESKKRDDNRMMRQSVILVSFKSCQNIADYATDTP
jgi:hypothetical protein